MRHIFIINNYSKKVNYSLRIREYLKEQENFEYLVFDTEYPLHEKEIAAKMCELFSDEVLRFYVCGGSGTLANVITGVSDMARVEIAFCPIGMSCDFLKCFMMGRRPFEDLENLIHGQVLTLDYMESSAGIRAVNTFSVGFDARVVKNLGIFRPLSLWNGKCTYVASILKTIFEYGGLRLKVQVDETGYEGKFMWVYLGNGRCCGSKCYPLKNVRPDDGVMDIFLMKKMSKLRFLFHMLQIQKGEIEKLGDHVICCRGKSVTISQVNGKALLYDYDGDAASLEEQKINLMPGQLKFVVPRGTQIYSE